MFRAQSLALYKNRPVLVLEARDKIEIRLDDGSTLKVREKDIIPLHDGPVSSLPAPAEGGDFETARRMLAPEAGAESATLPWAELAELVFGRSGPAEALACWKEASTGLLFRIEEGLPQPQGDEAVAREAEKRAKKEGEASERTAFIERAKRIKAALRSGKAETEAFLESDGRFLAEVEALALGRSSKSRTCADLGVAETPEAAQAFLLATGRWDQAVNPHPARSGCPLAAPRVSLGRQADALKRVDLTGMTSWAIDNAWSNDPDDAIAWDGTAAWIHVADPASAIAPDSAADKEALARGSTLYLPELVSPMLPDEALDRFGLGLSETSPALSFKVEVAQDGSLGAVEVMASTVRVRRASYGEADRVMAALEAPELAALEALAARRKARRVANGSVEIDIPEVRVKVAGEGPARSIDIISVPRDESSSLVREMMLLAGEAAARWAFERDLPFPYYGQEAPSEPGAAALGDSLSAQFARRRLMRSGAWGPGPSAHRGLGLPFYAQATSPLRRYQDLLAHMQARAFLSGSPVLDADEISRRCALAQAASAATRQAERSSVLHWILAYLAARPGWTGEAVVVGPAQGPGGKAAPIYVPELGLESRLRTGAPREADERIGIRLVGVDLAALEASFEELAGTAN
jgi:exoribonuclease II